VADGELMASREPAVGLGCEHDWGGKEGELTGCGKGVVVRA
jgi:hypothetical protein